MDDTLPVALNRDTPWVMAIQEIWTITRTLLDQDSLNNLPSEGLAFELTTAIGALELVRDSVNEQLGI